jgi:hypothetical protein
VNRSVLAIVLTLANIVICQKQKRDEFRSTEKNHGIMEEKDLFVVPLIMDSVQRSRA